MATDLPNVARVAVEGTFDGERFVNVLHFFVRDGSPWTLLDLANLLGVLDDAAGDSDSLLHFYANMDVDLVIDTLTATTLDNTTPIQLIQSVSLAGGQTDANLPPMLAIVAKWGTAIASRRYRGRTFLCGVNAGHVSATNADRVDSTVAASILSDLNDFVAAWGANVDFGFCVLSTVDRQDPLIVSPFQEVTAASLNPQICLQRRRRERS